MIPCIFNIKSRLFEIKFWFKKSWKGVHWKKKVENRCSRSYVEIFAKDDFKLSFEEKSVDFNKAVNTVLLHTSIIYYYVIKLKIKESLFLICRNFYICSKRPWIYIRKSLIKIEGVISVSDLFVFYKFKISDILPVFIKKKSY